jgi:RNA polymerase sigma-70 factor (ECF subfamily)
VDRKREQELIRAAQLGDTNAFALLYRAHVDKVYRYIYFRVDSAATAEDLTSDVFLQMVESLPTYQDRAIPLLVWLYRIAHARVIDHYRRSAVRRTEDIDTVDIRVEVDLDLPLVQAYTAEHLRAAMQALTEAQQQVITLRFIEGFNLEQTAQWMGKTVDAIKAMQYRALQALAHALKRLGFESEP